MKTWSGVGSVLTRTVEYALRAVACLANEDASLAASALAARTQTPRRYLHKVLQGLTVAQLVTSKSGPGGGYRLLRPADAITILDVVNAVGPLERIRQCPLGLAGHTSLCPLHQELDRVVAETEQAFAGTTIGQLLSSNGRFTPLCDLSPASAPVTLDPS